jgi:hypothetical protein
MTAAGSSNRGELIVQFGYRRWAHIGYPCLCATLAFITLAGLSLEFNLAAASLVYV